MGEQHHSLVCDAHRPRSLHPHRLHRAEGEYQAEQELPLALFRTAAESALFGEDRARGRPEAVGIAVRHGRAGPGNLLRRGENVAIRLSRQAAGEPFRRLHRVPAGERTDGKVGHQRRALAVVAKHLPPWGANLLGVAQLRALLPVPERGRGVPLPFPHTFRPRRALPARQAGHHLPDAELSFRHSIPFPARQLPASVHRLHAIATVRQFRDGHTHRHLLYGAP